MEALAGNTFAENSGETVANRGRVENLRPWPKGVSGNPRGRPKNDVAREIAQAVFEQNPEAIYKALTRALLKGNAYLFKQLADRAYGKVTNTVEVDVSAGMIAERIAEGRKRVLAGMTDEEIKDKIEQLRAQLDARSQGNNERTDSDSRVDKSRNPEGERV